MLSEDSESARALASLRVILIGREIRSASLLARILADQGARVTEAGSADNDPLRSGTPDVVIIGHVAGRARTVSVYADAVVGAGGVVCSFQGVEDGRGGQTYDEALLAAQAGLGQGAHVEPVPITSTYAAVWAAIAVVSECRRAFTRGRRGVRIEVPIVAAATTVLGWDLTVFEDDRLSDPLRRFAHLPISEIYETADGRFVQSQGLYPNFVEALCEAMERPEWREDASDALDYLPTAEEAASWRRRLSDRFRSRTAEEWEAAIATARGACTVCRTQFEWSLEPHAVETGILQHDGEGRLQVGSAVRVENVIAPLAESTRSDSERGGGSRRWPEVVDVADPDAPLAGLRVLDLCIVLAGPTCGRTLAELGADVIKIDDPHRLANPVGWLDVNRGKRSVLLDLRDEAARDVLLSLAAEADVLVENLREGKLAALGLDEATLHAANPDLIVVSLNAFDYGGRWSARPGWEQNAEAATGMQMGRPAAGRPEQLSVPVNDYATGLLGAFGVLCALFARQNGVRGGHRVRGSLARTATLLQIDDFEPDWWRRSRPTRASAGIRAQSRWIRVAGSPEEVADVLGHREDFERQTPSSLIEILRERGLTAVLERDFDDIRRDPAYHEQELVKRWEFSDRGALTQTGSVARILGIGSARGPAPEPGQDGVRTLEAMGCSSEEISSLIAREALFVSKRLFQGPWPFPP